MALALQKNPFTALPGENDPFALRGLYQEYLMKSLLVYLEKVKEGMKLPLDEIIAKISSLDTARHFSPALFAYYDLLKEGYRQKNIHQIFDTLALFTCLKEEELYTKKVSYSTIMTEEWEKPFVKNSRELQFFEDGTPVSPSVQMLPLFYWKAKDFPPKEVLEALNIMMELDAGLKNEFNTYVSSVKLYVGRSMDSVTSTRVFGAIFSRMPHAHEEPITFYLDHLVHELSHLHLYVIMGVDPLIMNPGNELFSSPLRKDKRPMHGVFHAAFILSRLVRIFKKLKNREGPWESIVAPLLKTKENDLKEALNVISSHAKLTDNGRKVHESMYSCASIGITT